MAGRARRILSDASETLRDLLRRIKEQTPEVVGRVARPKRLQRFDDASTRMGQIMAFCFVPPLIIVSLALIVAFNGVLASVFGSAWSTADQFTGPFAWVVTALTLGAFILAAYTWFQFVRTSGFGFFSTGAK